MRNELKEIGGQENLAALARTKYQELNLEDFKHWEGKIVNVNWGDKDSSLNSFGAEEWKEKRVLRVKRLGGGEIVAELEGYNQPVRVERLREIQSKG